jgi:hypothetical protein
MSMHRGFGTRLSSQTRAADIVVRGVSWHVHIFGIAIVDGDAFVEVALVGPTKRTATVRIAAHIVDGVTGRQLLDAVGSWLASDDRRGHGYLDARGAGRAKLQL